MNTPKIKCNRLQDAIFSAMREKVAIASVPIVGNDERLW